MPTTSQHTSDIAPWQLDDQAIQQVRTWLARATNITPDASAQQLAGVLKDPHGLGFTVGFVDRVIRPEDNATAGQALAGIAQNVPDFLPWYLQTAVKAGGKLARIAPDAIVPTAQSALRSLVGHLVIDARDPHLGRAIKRLRTDGISLNINLLGEAILGQNEAENRLAATLELIQRTDVDYVSVKVSATVAPHNHWAYNEAVENIVGQLRPLYRAAMNSVPVTFINLDMEEYKDLELTLDVFRRLISEPEFQHFSSGIVLQAYLPDAYQAMVDLQEFAAQRVAHGEAPIKVRVVKGANLPMEKVQAAMHDWPQTVWPTKQDTDTNYKRILNYALTPQRLANVGIGVAGHNLFDIALAYLLMQHRGIEINGPVDFEMLLGMATAQAEAVRADVGRLLLYTPVVHPDEFDVAISYLVRRLEEGASQDNFMSAVYELGDPELFDREAERFRASLAQLEIEANLIPKPRRQQNRAIEDYSQASPPEFANAVDTDPDLPQNRAWGRAILNRMADSKLGEDLVASHEVTSQKQLNDVITSATKAGATWQDLPLQTRSQVLIRIGDHLAKNRARLIEVMGSETGKTIDRADPEVSEGIDFARYYGQQCLELVNIIGATPHPVGLTVVTPPWNFPMAIPTGSITSALAAGSPVIVKPAPQAQRTVAVIVQAIWDALDEFDLPHEIVTYVIADEHSVGSNLVTDTRAERVILTGGYETAKLFTELRPEMPLFGETSGKNAIIVTPSADLDLAVADVVNSAFSHAGQKCSAASLVILVGQTARSKRFHRQLLDAVNSLIVDYPTNPQAQMGPVIEPPGEKLTRGLTKLENGQRWHLQPKLLDDTGRLYSPGIRSGIQPGSEYHMTEYFGPVLGVMAAPTLQAAIDYVNAVPYGLTSGIHSLDPEEIALWTDQVVAGNLYINRGITGAIVRRQPFGGWKRSSIGPGAKAGGPNYLLALTDWADAAATVPTIQDDLAAHLRKTTSSVLDAVDARWLTQAVAHDATAVETYTGQHDISNLQVEVNILRYRPVPVTIRVTDTDSKALAQALRVGYAGIRAQRAVATGKGTGALPMNILSLPSHTPEALTKAFNATNVRVVFEDTTSWLERARSLAQADPTKGSQRIRLIGDDETAATIKVTVQTPEVAVYRQPVTSAGRLEMLPFLREQSVTMTAHRFGTINDLPQQALGEIHFG
ncbi:bifunctional proline dehydrogenase/L-glutamate gamma-semialdehyde dehydrogenase [Enteractinococcus coprophilus]|uniref:L-glutamate gamma-semialdehyde dehydrogenase n=1 Tax=Enteractinococcus coprophilus TaxID=1027633 RepID=A0A543AJ03_9MICC|nr:bifunctional proline dehydrogenase/L-glutamate gamma-semialdehyde dehydrogenase [Enteractinococcus coprophilus]TQL72552.1 L-proline dehydrogenase [Enteractinococcus coprophilus]